VQERFFVTASIRPGLQVLYITKKIKRMCSVWRQAMKACLFFYWIFISKQINALKHWGSDPQVINALTHRGSDPRRVNVWKCGRLVMIKQ